MKYDKKGFTLIELLAVVAILAILAVVAVPNVLQLFQNSKKSTFKTQAQTLFKAAENQIINDQIGGKNYSSYCYAKVSDDPDTYASTMELPLTGSTSVYYSVTISGSRITSFHVTDGVYYVELTGCDNTDGCSISQIGDPIEVTDSNKATKGTITCPAS